MREAVLFLCIVAMYFVGVINGYVVVTETCEKPTNGRTQK